jgi:tetratricopeptide (TPR) repeat protein/2-polyprenyl-3-methyl-5-hydroxy-6-metoxy-1,4-benzoquinol methylase
MGKILEEDLSVAVQAHKKGDRDGAALLFDKLFEEDPDNPDVNFFLGLLSIEERKPDKALPYFKKAIEGNPKIGQFWISYIDALLQLGRVADAKDTLELINEDAKNSEFQDIEARVNSLLTTETKRPALPQEELQNLIALQKGNKFQLGLEKVETLINKFRPSADLYNIQGALRIGLREIDLAVESYNKAIEIKPENPDAYCNLGQALSARGDLEMAVSCYEKALEFDPSHYTTWHSLGFELHKKREFEASLNCYIKALEIQPDFEAAYIGFGEIVGSLKFTSPSPSVVKIFSVLFEKTQCVRPDVIMQSALSALKLEPNIASALRIDRDTYSGPVIEKVIADVKKTPFLFYLMRVSALCDLEFELFFTKLRAGLLLNLVSFSAPEELLEFQIALALQCFTNEYVYSQTGEERDALIFLEDKVRKNLSDGIQPRAIELACLGSYKPLFEYDWSGMLVNSESTSQLYIKQIAEPQIEKRLRKKIKTLSTISDNVSSAVRDQYEENPYPKWEILTRPSGPQAVSKLAMSKQLKIDDKEICRVSAPNILIAGCGMGHHALYSSLRFSNCNVLAIDLSLTSLAYARRKTEELGIKNIEYMQADILDIGELNREFDIIESVGVLHHMEDPMAGWRALVRSLRVGGLMKIGLYSEHARANINWLREEIERSRFEANRSDMEIFREKIIGSSVPSYQSITEITDFYSMSMFRDLLFHVQEHQFTLPKIEKSLYELGLSFCGFENRNVPEIISSDGFNEDKVFSLKYWDSFERDNPETFLSMYQFWCQKN